VQRQRILEERGWTIHRIWSTDWFRNKGQTVTLLIAAAARACGHKQ
jgi:very-short-patch-repair endonuclease